MQKISTYDKAASMLITLLILTGGTVMIMFVLWLSFRGLAQPTALPVAFDYFSDDGEDGGTGEDEEINPNVVNPGLDNNEIEVALEESVQTVIDIVAKNTAFSDTAFTSDPFADMDNLQSGGRTRGTGTGRAGRARRWEFRFDAGMTVPEYAKLLDQFGIELGVLQKDGTAICVSNLATANPAVRTLDTATEKRYYLTWLKKEGNNQTDIADREILAKAKISVTDQLILKFIPPPLEAELQRLEQEYAKGRSTQKIYKTSFAIRQAGAKPAFVVFGQAYKP